MDGFVALESSSAMYGESIYSRSGERRREEAGPCRLVKARFDPLREAAMNPSPRGRRVEVLAGRATATRVTETCGLGRCECKLIRKLAAELLLEGSIRLAKRGLQLVILEREVSPESLKDRSSSVQDTTIMGSQTRWRITY